jgi:hypothetical protein
MPASQCRSLGSAPRKSHVNLWRTRNTKARCSVRNTAFPCQSFHLSFYVFMVTLRCVTGTSCQHVLSVILRCPRVSLGIHVCIQSEDNEYTQSPEKNNGVKGCLKYDAIIKCDTSGSLIPPKNETEDIRKKG